MTWFSLTILTIIFWGVGQVLIKRGFSHLSPWQTYALDTIVTVFVWIPYGFLAGFNTAKIDLFSLVVVAFLGINFAGYYYIVNKAPISLASPIFACAPLGTLIISLTLFGESLSPVQIIAVVITIFGIILLTIPENNIRQKRPSWIYWALILTAVFSLEPILFKVIINRVGNGTFMILLSWGQIVAVILWYIIRPANRIRPQIPKKYILWTLIGVILFNLGTITDALALERGLASLVTPLTNLNVVLIIILSVIFLKEKINTVKVIGIVLSLIGIIIISARLETGNNNQPVNSQLIDAISITKSIAGPSSIIPTKSVQIYSGETEKRWETARVTYVFDGDTLELKDGRRVRLIGIDSPEISHKNQAEQCFAELSKDYTGRLLLGQEIVMEKDTSDKDKYGRLLRYVFRKGIFINDNLVRQGYAKAMNIPPDNRYADNFSAAQTEAKQNNIGLWKECI